MATHYVNSAAAGANNGTSETDAWTSLASATGVAAGDVIWVSHTHNQNPGASATYTFTNGTIANPVILVSVNFSTDAYTPASSAQFSGAASDLTLRGNVRVFGLSINIADDSNYGGATTGHVQVYEDCTIQGADNFVMTSTSGMLRWRNCSFVMASGMTWSLSASVQNMIWFTNCTFSGTAPSSSPTVGGDSGVAIFEDCDLSLFTSLFATIASGWTVVLNRCKVHSSLTFGTTISDTAGQAIMLDCDDGTISVAPLGINRWATYFGVARWTLDRYRTGGADDSFNANPYSMEMVSNANALEVFNPLRVTLAGRVVQEDGSISSATARGLFQSSRMAVLGTPAALTTDSDSTWNGTGVGTKQKVSFTLSNGQTLTVFVASGGTLNNDDFWVDIHEPDQVGGAVRVEVCLAKPSTTIYVDPFVLVA